jgi:hypothetical protein
MFSGGVSDPAFIISEKLIAFCTASAGTSLLGGA